MRARVAVRIAVVAASLAVALVATTGCSLLGGGSADESTAKGAGVVTPSKTTTNTAEETATPKPKPGKLAAVNADEARSVIGDGAFFIDLRAKADYALSHPKGATNVEVSDVHKTSKKWSKSSSILLFSYQDSVARSVGSYLARQGYKHVYYLERGVYGWDGEFAGSAVEQQTSGETLPKTTVYYYYVQNSSDWALATRTVNAWKSDFGTKVAFKPNPVSVLPVLRSGEVTGNLLFIVVRKDGSSDTISGGTNALVRAWSYIRSAVKGEIRTPEAVYSKEPTTW